MHLPFVCGHHHSWQSIRSRFPSLGVCSAYKSCVGVKTKFITASDNVFQLGASLRTAQCVRACTLEQRRAFCSGVKTILYTLRVPYHYRCLGRFFLRHGVRRVHVCLKQEQSWRSYRLQQVQSPPFSYWCRIGQPMATCIKSTRRPGVSLTVPGAERLEGEPVLHTPKRHGTSMRPLSYHDDISSKYAVFVSGESPLLRRRLQCCFWSEKREPALGAYPSQDIR